MFVNILMNFYFQKNKKNSQKYYSQNYKKNFKRKKGYKNITLKILKNYKKYHPQNLQKF